MEPGGKQPRIQLSIRMRSPALSRFVERALQDQQFFESAIDSPLAALRESGVRLDVARFTPSDVATFLGALAAVRSLAEKKQLKELSFEKIFGRAAEVLGTTIVAETQRGMWTQFQRDAFAVQEQFTSTSTKFEALTEARLEALASKELATLVDVDVRRNLAAARLRDIRFDMDSAGETVQSRETDHGVSFHFDADKGIGSSSSSKLDTYSTKNFAGSSLIEQVLDGPLVSPADLASLSAQLETFARIAGESEGG